jgi:hypothetical protein
VLLANSELLFASVYKYQGHAWIVARSIEPLSFRHEPILAGDLNAKRPFSNIAFLYPSGEKFLEFVRY